MKIIELAHLNNPHIADRGAFIFDPLDHLVIEKHCLPEKFVKQIIAGLLSLHVYMEIYAEHAYFIQRDQLSDFTKVRTTILQQNPKILTSLVSELPLSDIIKINAFSNTNEEKQKVQAFLKRYQNDVATGWVGNPAMGKTEAVNIIPKGISKMHAMEVIFKNLLIENDCVLGVGDSISDWDFMSACGYVAAMGNASKELKNLVRTKEDGKYFIAPHVDENGILDIFRFFNL